MKYVNQDDLYGNSIFFIELVFNVHRGVLTMRIAEHFNGKKNLNLFAH